jgi:molybdopterin converting factor subunit 1
MSDLEISLTDDATVADAARELLCLHPAISSDSSRLMIAVNEEYQEHDYPLSENDEVAFIPPVSGG